MKEFGAFIFGVIVGGIAALLMAPMSGEELRRQIQVEADAELKKVDAEWQKILKQVNKTVEDTQAELRAYMEKSESDESSVADDEASAEVAS